MQAQLVRHTGSCHCGRVRFAVQAPAVLRVKECNCSICSVCAYQHLIVSRACFELLCGEQVLSTYTFNTGTAKHLFCSFCGVKPFYVPRSHPDGYSANARCLDPSTVRQIKLEPFDGRHWEQNVDGLRMSG
jgi:hypothetical protein